MTRIEYVDVWMNRIKYVKFYKTERFLTQIILNQLTEYANAKKEFRLSILVYVKDQI